MNIAEWILVAFLSVTLLVFLVVAIIAIIKWNHLVDEARKIAVKGQDIADNANDVVENVKGFTSLGSVVQTIADSANTNLKKKK